jgi:hypothetical protein
VRNLELEIFAIGSGLNADDEIHRAMTLLRGSIKDRVLSNVAHRVKVIFERAAQGWRN